MGMYDSKSTVTVTIPIQYFLLITVYDIITKVIDLMYFNEKLF